MINEDLVDPLVTRRVKSVSTDEISDKKAHSSGAMDRWVGTGEYRVFLCLFDEKKESSLKPNVWWDRVGVG